MVSAPGLNTYLEVTWMRKLMVGTVLEPVQLGSTLVLALTLVLGSAVAAHQQPATDRFAAVAVLVGKWSGTSEGQPGTAQTVAVSVSPFSTVISLPDRRHFDHNRPETGDSTALT